MRLARQLRFRRPDSPVSLSQLSALSTLAKEGAMTPGALALRERVRPPSMTRVIASLAELGFVARSAHPADGRQVLVSVSPTRRGIDRSRAESQPGMAEDAAFAAQCRPAQGAARRCRPDVGARRRKSVRVPAGHERSERGMSSVVDVDDPADPRLDDFRDLNSVDRRPDLPTGKGLVIAEGVLVVQRMLASRFRPRAMLGTDRRLRELARRPRGDRRPLLPGDRRGDGRRGRVPPQPRGARRGAAAR